MVFAPKITGAGGPLLRSGAYRSKERFVKLSDPILEGMRETNELFCSKVVRMRDMTGLLSRVHG